MPAESEKQQKAAGMALAVQRGEMSRSRLRKHGAARKMLKMETERLRHFAKKPREK